MRAETGVVKFGDDWSGVFIRGDHALHYAMIMEKIPEAGLDVLELSVLKSLRELFLSCAEPNPDVSRAYLRSYPECRSGD